MVYLASLNLILWLIRTFLKENSHNTFLEMPMGSRLANRKWSCYLENWDSSGINNHFEHFLNHLKLSSEKIWTDAQPFLYLVSSRLRRHFVLDDIVFLVN